MKPEHFLSGEKSGGGKGGGGNAKTIPDTLTSEATASILHLISSGVIEGWDDVDPLKCVYIDNVPIRNSDGTDNAKGVDFNYRLGTPSQDVIPGNDRISNFESVGIQMTASIWPIYTIVNSGLDAIKVWIKIPAMAKNDPKTGEVNGNSVTFTLDYKCAGQNTWTTFQTPTISEKFTSPQDFLYRLNLKGLGAFPILIRARRITADSTDVADQKDTTFHGVTEIYEDQLTYPGYAIAKMTAYAKQFGDHIGEVKFRIKGVVCLVPTNYDPVARTYADPWDGNFKQAFTNNPAWILYSVLVNKDWGLGRRIRPTQVDKWTLYEISKRCDELVSNGAGGMEPRYTFTMHVQSRQEARKALQSIASTFNGMIYAATSKILFSQDKPKPVKRLITNANVIGGKFTYEGFARSTKSSVALVTWNDPLQFGEPVVEAVTNPAMIRKVGWKPKDIIAAGCTSRSQARRQGKWALFSEQYEDRAVTFRGSLELADLIPGDVIKIADAHRQGIRFGGRILAISSATVTLDAPLVISAQDVTNGVIYYLWLTLPDGTPVKKQIVATAGSHTVLTFTSALSGILPQDLTSFIISSSAFDPPEYTISATREVSSKEPYVELICMKYYREKFPAIEDGYQFEPGSEVVNDSRKPIEPVTSVSAAKRTVNTPTGGKEFVTLSYVKSPNKFVVKYKVIHRFSNGDWEISETYSNNLDLPYRGAGAYEFNVIPISVTGREGQAAYVSSTISESRGLGRPTISGLSLINGTNGEFIGKDVSLAWALNPPTGITDPAYEDPYFRDYQVQILTTGDVVKRELFTTSRSLRYTREQNIQDNGGTPLSTFKVKVRMRDTISSEGAGDWISLTVTNPRPVAPAAPTLTQDADAIRVRWTKPTDLDYAGTVVHFSTVPNFVPSDVNKVFDGKDEARIPVSTETTYYVKIGHYDEFDATTINYSPQASLAISGTFQASIAQVNQSLTDIQTLFGTTTSAQAALQAAQASAAAAEGYKNAAATSASNAAAAQTASQTAATSAETAAANALTYRNDASTSASNAAASAATSTTQATNAANSANAASGSATAASGSASLASTKAADSASSASAALASQVSASSSAASAIRTVSASFPADFSEDGRFFIGWITGSEDAAPKPEEYYTTGISYPTTADGKVLRISYKTGYVHIGGRKRISTALYAGRTIRTTVKFRVISSAPVPVGASINYYGLTQDFANIGYSGYGTWSAPAGSISGVPDTNATNGIVTLVGDIVPSNANLPWIATDVFFYTSSGHCGIIDILSFKVEDVTESLAAAGSATASAASAAVASTKASEASTSAISATNSSNNAATQAGNSSASASAASGSAAAAASSATSAASSSASAATYANLVAQYKQDVIAVNRNSSFQFGLDGWGPSINGLGSFGSELTIGAGFGSPSNAIAINGVQASVVSRAAYQIDTARSYRFRARVGAYKSPDPGGIAQVYLGFVGLDIDGNIVDHGGHGSYRYCLGPSTIGLPNGVCNQYEAIVTGTGNDSWTKFPPGTVQIKLIAFLNYNSTGLQVYLDYLEFEDVTAELAAASSAGVATAQAVVATSAASAAQASMVVSATIGQGSLNANPKFAAWTNASVQPDSWGLPYGNPSMFTRVASGLGGYYADVTVGSTQSHEFSNQSNTGVITGGNYYIVGCDVETVSGDITGAAMRYYFYDSSWNNILGGYLQFPTDIPVGQASAIGLTPVGGKRYTFQKLIQAGATASAFYIGLSAGGLSANKTLTGRMKLYGAWIRPATAAEIRDQTVLAPMEATVSTHASTIATLQSRTASWITKVSSGTGSAVLTMSSTDVNGNAASFISLIANKVLLSADKVALELVGGAVRISGNLSASAGIALGTTGNLWRIALASKDYVIKDGDTVSFGVDLGALPQLDFSTMGLDPLGSGEVYDLYAESLTSTSFIARLKIRVPGTPSIITLTTDTTPGTGPTRQIDKSGYSESQDGNYEFRIQGSATVLNEYIGNYQ